MRKVWVVAAGVLMAACMKIDLSELEGEESDDGGGDVEVTFRASEMMTRASGDVPDMMTRAAVGDLSSRLSFAVFHNGERVKTTEHQEKGVDDDYGTYRLRLDKGVYELVVVAHNGANNCTITSPDKVTFRNGHVTDTFCGYEQFTIGERDTTLAVMMQRVVARMELTSTTQHPSDVCQMKFYYTGGSSTLSPRLMQGVVQSRQTEVMDAALPDVYTLYTFPYKAATSSLKLTIYSMDEQGTEIDETTYTGIPVEVRRTTKMTGSLFDKHGVIITIPDSQVEWGEDIEIEM